MDDLECGAREHGFFSAIGERIKGGVSGSEAPSREQSPSSSSSKGTNNKTLTGSREKLCSYFNLCDDVMQAVKVQSVFIVIHELNKNSALGKLNNETLHCISRVFREEFEMKVGD